MKPGDIVIKRGDFDAGIIGLILEINSTPLGYVFVKVVTGEGIIKTWYKDKVEVLSENST